jgi:hypothetical protein
MRCGKAGKRKRQNGWSKGIGARHTRRGTRQGHNPEERNNRGSLPGLTDREWHRNEDRERFPDSIGVFCLTAAVMGSIPVRTIPSLLLRHAAPPLSRSSQKFGSWPRRLEGFRAAAWNFDRLPHACSGRDGLVRRHFLVLRRNRRKAFWRPHLGC